MSRPPGVAEADPSYHRFGIQPRPEAADLAHAAPDLERPVVVDHRQAGGVVPAVLQSLEPVEDDGRGVLTADVAEDSTHGRGRLRQARERCSVACRGKLLGGGISRSAPTRSVAGPTMARAAPAARPPRVTSATSRSSSPRTVSM